MGDQHETSLALPAVIFTEQTQTIGAHVPAFGGLADGVVELTASSAGSETRLVDLAVENQRNALLRVVGIVVQTVQTAAGLRVGRLAERYHG